MTTVLRNHRELNHYLAPSIILLAVIGCFVISAYLSGSISRERLERGYVSKVPKITPVDVPVNQFLGAAIMTGFRGIAADLLWLKCDHFWHSGQWHKLLPYYYFITRLQPRFITVWVIGGWHMAYNVSYRVAHDVTLPEPERDIEGARWVERGIAFLKEGLQYNTDKYDIYFELGWTYFHKLRDYRESVLYLEQALERKHPQWVRRVLAHAYQHCGRYKEAYAIWDMFDKETGGKDGPAKRFMAELSRPIDGMK